MADVEAWWKRRKRGTTQRLARFPSKIWNRPNRECIADLRELSTNALRTYRQTVQVRNDQASPLLRLPAELRNIIYALAVVETDGYYLGNPCGRDKKLWLLQPPLCLASSRLYHEVRPVFYGQNAFTFADEYNSPLRASHIRGFRSAAGEHAGLVTEVTIYTARPVNGSARMEVETMVRLVGKKVELSGAECPLLKCSCPLTRERAAVFNMAGRETPLLDFLEQHFGRCKVRSRRRRLHIR